MRNSVLFAALLPLTAAPATAGETAWTEVMPGSRLRLISSDMLVDGKTTIGLELDMPESTWTYWRIPGETGIPTQIEVSGLGLTGQSVLWPIPRRKETSGYIDYVYPGPTVLPLELELAGNGSFSAAISLGICEEICVPVNINISFQVDFSKADRGQDLRLRQALANVPLLWEGDNPPVGEVWYEPENGRIAVEIDPRRLDPNSLLVDNGDPSLLFGAPQKSPESGLFYLKLLERGQKRDLRGGAVRLTFLTSDGAFEVDRVVQ